MRWFTENEEVFELWKPGEMSNDLKISHKKLFLRKLCYQHKWMLSNEATSLRDQIYSQIHT